jgi:putative molybdopterin biosynthesis protein
VAVGRVGKRLLAAPLASGAGVITSLVQADGIVVIPRGIQGLEAGERVDVRLYRTRSELERTVFCIGSHDVTLDLLAQLLSPSGRRLVSANVGSQGVSSRCRGLAHLAGRHLLDRDRQYNISSIRKHDPYAGEAREACALREG